MKVVPRIAALCLTGVLTVSSFIFPASAATNTAVRNSSGKSFNREWEMTVTYYFKPSMKELGYMTYGYDTDWINEDYVWVKATECAAQGYIWRGSYDTYWMSDGKSSGAGKYSETEIRHRTKDTEKVKYKAVFDAYYGSNFVEGAPQSSFYKD